MGLVIVIAHPKGGVGKSTIATNLAVEISKLQKVTAINLDVQKSLTYFNVIRKETKQPLTLQTTTNFKELQEIVNNNKQTLIIDVGGFDSDLNRAAMLGADIIITPVSDSAIEIVELLSFKNILKEVHKSRPELKVSVLLNRIHANAKSSLEKLKGFVSENPEFKLLNSVLRDRIEFKKAFEAGLSVNELNPNSKAASEINKLIKEIING